MNKQSKTAFAVIISMLILFLGINVVKAENLTTKLKGKILLQVEQNGEAWYLNPADETRYFMGRPDDAFSLMRSLGVGISNNDLQKIQIADENLTGTDDDNDGLSNMIEDSIGTNKAKSDTDNDGYSDKDEILNGYNPNGSGALNIDNNFANDQTGRILLQVEQNGEAWYVNPDDNKRYFLGRPNDAFNLMRKLGLGITNTNLESIKASNNSKKQESQINNNSTEDIRLLSKEDLDLKAGFYDWSDDYFKMYNIYLYSDGVKFILKNELKEQYKDAPGNYKHQRIEFGKLFGDEENNNMVIEMEITDALDAYDICIFNLESDTKYSAWPMWGTTKNDYETNDMMYFRTKSDNSLVDCKTDKMIVSEIKNN